MKITKSKNKYILKSLLKTLENWEETKQKLIFHEKYSFDGRFLAMEKINAEIDRVKKQIEKLPDTFVETFESKEDEHTTKTTN